MKRAGMYVVAGAVAGFAGVLGLHRGSAPAVPPLSQPKAGGAGASQAPPSGAPPSGATGSGQAAGPATPSGPVKQAAGTLVQYGYGELSVKVVVRGNQIINVSVPVLRTAEPYSQQLAQQVIPMLRSEVLAAHSARINGVSGATYTSAAYAQSIQSALDKLHLR